MKYNNHTSIRFSGEDDEPVQLVPIEEALHEFGYNSFSELLRIEGGSQLEPIEASKTKKVFFFRPNIERLKTLLKNKLKGVTMEKVTENPIYKLVYLDPKGIERTEYITTLELINLTDWSNNQIALTKKMLGNVKDKSSMVFQQFLISKIVGIAEVTPGSWQKVEESVNGVRMLLPNDRPTDEILGLVGLDKAPDLQKALRDEILLIEAADYLKMVKEKINTAIRNYHCVLSCSSSVSRHVHGQAHGFLFSAFYPCIIVLHRAGQHQCQGVQGCPEERVCGRACIRCDSSNA